MRFLPVVPVVLLALAAGCGADGPADRSDPGPTAGAPPGAGPTYTEPSDSPACAAVRDGIDAFNAGDLPGTVEHFERAVPLAQAQLDGSPEADDLLEAVEWYAALPAEDYPEASRSSPDFARYQAITLGQCRPVGEPGGPPSEPGEQI